MPSWTKRKSAGQPPTASKTPRRIATAPSHTAVMSLERERSPTRRRGTQSRAEAPPSRGATRSCSRPSCGSASKRRATARERVRRGEARVVVEEEQQLAARVRDAEVAPGRDAEVHGRADAAHAVRAAPSAPTRCRPRRCRARRRAGPAASPAPAAGPPAGGPSSAGRSRTSPQAARGEDRDQVPDRGDRRDRDERDRRARAWRGCRRRARRRSPRRAPAATPRSPRRRGRTGRSRARAAAAPARTRAARRPPRCRRRRACPPPSRATATSAVSVRTSSASTAASSPSVV